MTEIDIMKELSSKREEVDGIIKKYIPREYDEKSLEFTVGKARYEYDKVALSNAISKPLWEFLDRGGKRWRPSLFMITMEAFGCDPSKYMDFVLVPELAHNGSLVVDDIEDSSELRRGIPCAHILHGTDIAVNFGNAMYFLPLLAFIKNKDKLDKDTLIKVYEIYSQEMINIHYGQAMDIYWHKGKNNADNVTERQYLQMCAYKTGTLARMSVKIAAALCNANEADVEKLGKFAETIGIAFQIQDDLLNLTAESGQGQFVEEYLGSDVSEGKRSMMVIHTLQNGKPEDKQRLKDILDMHTKEKEILKEAIEILKRNGSMEYSKKRAKDLMEESWKEVDSILKPSPAKDKLFAFAKYLIEREV